MKKIFFLLVAVLSVGTVSACVKKMPSATNQSECTIIVMDSTQALLSGAQVTLGKNEWTTSYDGRVVLKAGKWREGDKVKVSLERYKEVTVKLSSSCEPTLVVLERKPLRSGKDDTEIVYATGISSKYKDYPAVRM